MTVIYGSLDVAPATANPITVTVAETVLFEISVDGAEVVTLDLSNSGAALTTCKVYIRVHGSASYHEIALTLAAYVMDYTAGIGTLASGSSGIIRLDVSAIESVKVTATCATSTAVTALGRKDKACRP